MTTEPTRWDDYVLAGLLLLISAPRAMLALQANRPLGTEDTLSMMVALVAVMLLVGLARRRS